MVHINMTQCRHQEGGLANSNSGQEFIAGGIALPARQDSLADAPFERGWSCDRIFVLYDHSKHEARMHDSRGFLKAPDP
ncbi:hypothetical protein PsYK624_070680 [Phanerochaete sordida]|uniref:Uncharacterized protein n=1 Tax=Phanerochaete sordida TaxID=48140 RepID=A0A9P3G7X8_9APHY|nr:hypothetical protein PsYK624_070680 [Phanerochaete sordida]